MKKSFILLSLILSAIPIHGQEEPARKFHVKNSIQLDLGGPAVFYAVSYERILLNGNQYKTSFQSGISYYPPSTGMRDIWIPLGINEIYSLGKHHIEGGLGYMPIIEASRDENLVAREWYYSSLLTGRIGYRFQKPDGHLILRAAFTPVLELDRLGKGGKFHPLGGISVGYGF